MKSIKSMLVAAMIATGLTLNAQSPTILCPTNGQVFYNGDKMEIKWRSSGAGLNERVYIALLMAGTDQGSWIAAGIENTGSFAWTVTNNNLTHTNFTIMVSDAYDSYVSVLIVNGIRPPAPRSVPISVRKAVSVEWMANTNSTYQVQASADMRNWTTVAQGRSDTTNAVAVFYAEQPNQFFRVYDVTP